MSFKRATLITVLLCSGPVAYAAAAALPEPLVACTRLQDSLQRLVCFDREMAAQGVVGGRAPVVAPVAAPATSAAPAAVASAAPASAAPASAAPVSAAPAASGAAPAAPQLGDELLAGKSRPAKGPAETSLTAGITALREISRGIFLISLENGQIWRQQEAALINPLRVGESIRINRGALGSYMLTRLDEGSNRWIRVHRVK